MQEVAHKIHIKKNGTQYDVNLYDNKFPSPDIFFPVKISGSAYYIPATPYLNEDAAGGRTPLRIKKDGTTYQIIKKAECIINIPTYDNQKIVVEVTNSITGNKATYEKTVVVPFGSSFTATVQSTNSSYNAGSMTSVSSGTITEKNINLTASPATIAIPTGEMVINSKTSGESYTLTIPNGINVVKVVGKGYSNYSPTTYVGVTPGKTYRLRTLLKPPDVPPRPEPFASIIHSDSDNYREEGTEWITIIGYGPYSFTLSWSPEINKITPQYKDY